MKLISTGWANPVAKVSITTADLALLMLCSSRHYDAVCRSAGTAAYGGFIAAWQSRLAMIRTMPAPFGETVPDALEVDGTFEQFDLCCKILETNAETFEAEGAFTARFQLRGTFAAVLDAVNEQAGEAPPEEKKKTGHDLPADEPAEPDYKALYYTLIYAVARKFDNETRFDTALRYIRQCEDSPRPGLQLRRKEDGLWLRVTLPTGSEALINIVEPAGEITKGILLRAAIDDRPVQAEAAPASSIEGAPPAV